MIARRKNAHLLRWVTGLFFGATLLLSGCGSTLDRLAPVAAQPKTPVARNFTNFSASLQCMDGLFAAKKQRRIRLSATPISDDTKKIYVGADDMLISAVNRMNRRSRAFVFLDQPLIREGSLYELQTLDPKTRDKAIQPQYYIRGSISQLDDRPRRIAVNGYYTADDTQVEDFSTVRPSAGRTNSVVTVDLHLVAFPSREVLPGASVSNSMVVTQRSFGAGFTGRIIKGSLGLTLQIDSMESNGQAVRNLIELATIELLGRFSGVPYWDCLSLEDTNARRASKKERLQVAKGNTQNTLEAQRVLVALGRMAGPPTGKLDRETRRILGQLQAENGLIASGQADFDTIVMLRKTLAKQTKPARVPATKPPSRRKTPIRVPTPVDQGGYKNISEYLTAN